MFLVLVDECRLLTVFLLFRNHRDHSIHPFHGAMFTPHSSCPLTLWPSSARGSRAYVSQRWSRPFKPRLHGASGVLSRRQATLDDGAARPKTDGPAAGSRAPHSGRARGGARQRGNVSRRRVPPTSKAIPCGDPSASAVQQAQHERKRRTAWRMHAGTVARIRWLAPCHKATSEVCFPTDA